MFRACRTTFPSWVTAIAILGSGCSREVSMVPERTPMTLDELAITVREGSRTALYSDKRGGFLVASAGNESNGNTRWDVNGTTILNGIDVAVNRELLRSEHISSTRVSPDCLVREYAGGTSVMLAPLEGLGESEWGIGIIVRTSVPSDIAIRFSPASGWAAARGDGESVQWTRHDGTLIAFGGENSRTRTREVAVAGNDSLAAILLYSERDISPSAPALQLAKLSGLIASRRARLERLLNRSYLRVSDTLLTRALGWTRLMLDGAVIESGETLAVASHPWDGSFDGRANLQAVSGIAVAVGEPGIAGTLLRSWAATQDTRSAGPTYGRMARRIRSSPPIYDGIDVGGLFLRGLYDCVVATNDTALAVEFYPVIRRSIEGMLKNSVDENNLVRHSARETWMGPERFKGSRGPFSAVEVQVLWQYQQIIGSYVGELAGDTATARRWVVNGLKTSAQIAENFVDSGKALVYDFLDGSHHGVESLRPNVIIALDGLESERIQQSVIKRSVNNLLYRFGPGTLGSGQDGFHAGIRGTTNGPVATWLLGPFTYAVSRYDRQDMAYDVAQSFARLVLDEGLVGALPGVLSVEGKGEAREQGEAGSLVAMAEFVRSFYQDYLGIRVDAPSRVVRFEPKLPPAITDAEFSFTMAGEVVEGSYRKSGEQGRISIALPQLPWPIKWRFTWMLENGDAWVGAIPLKPGKAVTVVFGPQELLAYEGVREVEVAEKWLVSRLSRRSEIPDLEFAAVRQE